MALDCVLGVGTWLTLSYGWLQRTCRRRATSSWCCRRRTPPSLPQWCAHCHASRTCDEAARIVEQMRAEQKLQRVCVVRPQLAFVLQEETKERKLSKREAARKLRSGTKSAAVV